MAGPWRAKVPTSAVIEQPWNACSQAERCNRGLASPPGSQAFMALARLPAWRRMASRQMDRR